MKRHFKLFLGVSPMYVIENTESDLDDFMLLVDETQRAFEEERRSFVDAQGWVVVGWWWGTSWKVLRFREWAIERWALGPVMFEPLEDREGGVS